MKKKHKLSLAEQFARVHVAVIGDIMLDLYTLGRIERLSPEAPVPVVLDEDRRYILGGAANVARNAAALGAKVSLIGILGSDAEGAIVRSLIKEFHIDAKDVLIDASRPTTTKNRIMVGHHQVLRIDQETKTMISPAIEKKMIAAIKASKANIIIFSDYAKGAITKNMVAAAIKKFGSARVLVDFKPSQEAYYRNVGFLFPNLKEANELTGIHAITEPLAKKVAELLAKKFGASVVLKRSEHGMTLYANDRAGVIHIPARAREIFDVTGAGDTVIATMALALAAGVPFIQAGEIANHAAGIVVEMEGTAVPDMLTLIERAGL